MSLSTRKRLHMFGISNLKLVTELLTGQDLYIGLLP